MEESLSSVLQTKNPFAQEQWKESLQRWPKTLRDAVHRANLFQTCKSFLHNHPEQAKEVDSDFETLLEAQEELAPLLRESTTIESEGYGQVCFQGNPWSLLNSIPFALTALSIFKSYIVPSFSIILPLISWILPFLLLKSFYNIPISFGDYTSILWRLWNGQALPRTPQELLHPPAEEEIDITKKIKQWVQNGWTLFTVGQAMWQPITQAKHFKRLDSECLTYGNSIVRVKEVGQRFVKSAHGFLPSWLQSWIEKCPNNSREAFAFVLDNRFWLPHLFRCLGRFEVLWTLAKREDTVAVSFVQSNKPILLLKEFGDPSIPLSKRVLSSIRLGGSQASHSIVTGPNRGGKSSFMRGVACNIQLAHAFGACFAQKAQMSRFAWIANGLRLADVPGEQSMFEKEVSFTAGILNKINTSKDLGFVFYDEIFHSTNPPDATRASQLFCSELWKHTSCLSLISTHVYSLAKEAPSSVKQLCLATTVSAKGKYHFTYKVKRGVCEVSSVDLLLRQFGFPCGQSMITKPASDC